jgi:hypothetical protein
MRSHIVLSGSAVFVVTEQRPGVLAILYKMPAIIEIVNSVKTVFTVQCEKVELKVVKLETIMESPPIEKPTSQTNKLSDCVKMKRAFSLERFTFSKNNSRMVSKGRFIYLLPVLQ